MMTAAPTYATERLASMSGDFDGLTDIYQDQVNMAVWKRELEQPIKNDVNRLLNSAELSQFSAVVSTRDAENRLTAVPGLSQYPALREDLLLLIDMFSCLFDLDAVGVRFTPLQKAMCPKFHVDHVPCRLITTYVGTATQWLDHAVVDRSKLGRGSLGLADDVSGLYPSPDNIQQLNAGDVALLKGERWQGNEGGGLVHRSPALADGETRLLLTLDFV